MRNTLLTKFFLIALLVAGFMPFSCIQSNCGKGVVVLPYYDVTGLAASVYRLNVTNPSDPKPQDTLSFHQFRIHLNAKLKYYAATKPRLLFGNAAYACSILENGHAGTKELVDSLIIESDVDFDSAHPKGTSLNDVFDFVEFTKPITLTKYLSKKPIQAPQHLPIALNRKPMHTAYKFKINMYLSTGEYHFVETDVILIK